MELTHTPSPDALWARPRGLIRWIVFLVGATCAAVYAVRPEPKAVVTPARKDVTKSIAYAGTIHSGRATGVGAALDGTIARLAVRPGQKVAAGDLLFALDRTPLREQIHALERAIREMERERRDLHSHDAAPEYRQALRALERATAHLAARERHGYADETDHWAYAHALEAYHQERAALWKSQADRRKELHAARRELAVLYARLPLYERASPVAGLVTEVHARPGQGVARGEPLVRIEDPRKVAVRLLVEENEQARVRSGQTASVRVGRNRFQGQVTDVTSGVGRELWQAWVTVKPVSLPPAFQDGQSVQVRLVTNRYPGATVLPRTAVRHWRTGAVVYIVRDGRIEERMVRAVEVDTGEMAVLNGLEPDESVIRHSHAVHAGQRVIPQPS